MRRVTIKVDEDLKKKMGTVKINWSEYIRDAVQRRIELGERRVAGEKLLEDLRKRRTPLVPSGFINRTIREMREAR